jgi:hypothetical protein
MLKRRGKALQGTLFLGDIFGGFVLIWKAAYGNMVCNAPPKYLIICGPKRSKPAPGAAGVCMEHPSLMHLKERPIISHHQVIQTFPGPGRECPTTGHPLFNFCGGLPTLMYANRWEKEKKVGILAHRAHFVRK